MKLMQIELAPNAPVALALDRSMSMSTRDCPEGMSRWEFAISALREAMSELCSSQRRVTLLTFGRDVHVIENARPEHLDTLTMGDGACCTGQAAADALYFAPPASSPYFPTPAGAAVIISDGVPDGDTRIGKVLLGTPHVMQALFERTCFVTVGAVSEPLQRFAELWPNHCRLEDATAATADTLPPPAEDPPQLLHDALGITPEHAAKMRVEHGDGIDPRDVPERRVGETYDEVLGVTREPVRAVNAKGEVVATGKRGSKRR